MNMALDGASREEIDGAARPSTTTLDDPGEIVDDVLALARK